MLQFSKALIGLHESFDINDTLNIFVKDSNTRETRVCKLSFAAQLEVFKEILNIQREKGGFNFDKLRPFIFSLSQKIEKENLQEKQKALEQTNNRRLQLQSKISAQAANRCYPYFSKGFVQQIEALLGNEVSLKNNPSIIQRLYAEVEASNLFLVSKAGLYRVNYDQEKLTRLKDKNNRLKARIGRLFNEMIELKNDLQNLQKQYVTRFLELISRIQETLDNEGLESAEQSLSILNHDPLLLELLKEGEGLETQFSQIPAEFSKIEQELISQREKEKIGELSFLDKQKQDQIEELEAQKLAKFHEDLKLKLEEVDLALKKELKKEEEALKLQKAALRARKEEQRNYAFQQDEERKKTKEQALSSKKLDSSQAVAAAKELKLDAEMSQTVVVSKQPKKENKQADERQIQKRVEERRKRLFPLTLASKSGLMTLLRLSPEARVLKEIMDDTEIFSKQDFLGNPADKLCARLACLGMMSRIMEIIFRKGGLLSISDRDAEQFRDVISHSKNSFLGGFSDEEIFKLTALVAQYVFAILVNDKQNIQKFFSLLKENETYTAFLKHDLESNKEPFEYEYYESERKFAKEQEIQVSHCLVLSMTQFEHANGHCVGRIGGFIRRMMRYHRNHPKFLSSQAGFDQDLAALRSREEMESYLVGGREYRHAKTDAAGFEITQRLVRTQISLEGQAAPSPASALTTPALASGRTYLPTYEENKHKHKNASPSPFSSTSGKQNVASAVKTSSPKSQGRDLKDDADGMAAGIVPAEMPAMVSGQPGLKSTSAAVQLGSASNAAPQATHPGKKKKKGKKKGKG